MPALAGFMSGAMSDSFTVDNGRDPFPHRLGVGLEKGATLSRLTKAAK